MYNFLRIKFLYWKRKWFTRKRVINDKDYDAYKKDIIELIQREGSTVHDLEFMIELIRNSANMPDDKKADMIVTLRDILHHHPAYKFIKYAKENDIL